MTQIATIMPSATGKYYMMRIRLSKPIWFISNIDIQSNISWDFIGMQLVSRRAIVTQHKFYVMLLNVTSDSLTGVCLFWSSKD